jgi:Flp pilus assembly pilin Flp
MVDLTRPLIVWLFQLPSRLGARLRAVPGSGDGGQATVEYALVVLAAAAIALLLIAWATGTGKIGELLDRVFDSVANKVT